MKNLSRVLTAVVILAFLLGACAPATTPAPAAKKVVVGLVMKSLANQYFKDMQDGAQKWADANNIDLKPVGIQNETDVDAQIAAVEGLITQKVDIIVLAPANSVALAPVAKKAVDAGITVVNMDVAFDAKALADNGLTGLPYVGPDNRAASKLAGDALGKVLPKGAKVIILEGVSGADNATQRTNGFKDSVAEYGMTLVDSLTADWETEKANTVTAAELTAHPDIQGIMSDNDSMVLGAIKAVEAAGLTGKIQIVGFDNIAPVQDLIKQGKVLATVDQFGSQQAVFAIQAGLKMLKGEKLTGWIKTDVKLITAAELGGAAAVATTAPAANKPTITQWVDTGGDATVSKCIIDKVIGGFNAKDNSFIVEGQPQANAWDAIRTAVAGGGGPDIVYTPGPSFVYEMAKAGQLLPLDSYAQSLNWDKQFLPWALSLGKVDGKLYSIPHEVETLVLYYNKTVFDAHGWKPPTTIDEYLQLVKDIKAAGLIPNAAGNSDWKPADEHYWSIFVNHIAGPQKVYDALTGKTPWTDPAIVNAVDTMDQLFMNGDFMSSLDLYYTTDSTSFLTALGDGKAAMAPSGTWWMGTIGKYFGAAANNSNDWDWVPFPTTDGKPLYTLGIGSTYSINAATKYPDESAQYLTYFFSPEAQSIAITQCGVAPAPINISADQLQGIDPRRARLIAELNKAAGAGQYGYTTWTFWPPKSDAYIYDEIEKVWGKQMTLDDYMKGLDALFQEELKAGSIPPIPQR